MLRRLAGTLLVPLLLAPAAPAADEKPRPLTPWQLRTAFHKKPTGKDLERLRDQVVATFGEKELEKGARPRVQETMAVFAITITEDESDDKVVPRLLLNNGLVQAAMQPLGPDSNLFLVFADVQNFAELNYMYQVGKRRTGQGVLQVEHYNPDLDSLPQATVPRGKLPNAT